MAPRRPGTGRWPGAAWMLLLAAGAALGGHLLLGCSTLLDFGECESHADCYRSKGSRYVCSPERYCIFQPLESSRVGCKLDEGMEFDERSVVVATLLTGSTEQKQRYRERAALLALEQIDTAGGLDDHRFSLLRCSPPAPAAGEDPYSGTLAAAEHLRATRRVAAVLGACSSQQTIDVFQDVFRDAGILLISPSATSAAISFLDDGGLLWRTAPTDLGQGRALAHYARAWSPTRVAFVGRDDAYGRGLQETFSREFCGEERCTAEHYLSRTVPAVPAATSPPSAQLVAELEQFSPDLVVAVIYTDFALQLIPALERSVHPGWLLSDGAYSPDLATSLSMETSRRIRGTK
ncbi:MAG: hypothetical protein FJ125_08775, partial [Deltaproteobacteria bacterium]|nr:hypothetical protein [Deltaproteobacteria bacterium]